MSPTINDLMLCLRYPDRSEWKVRGLTDKNVTACQSCLLILRWINMVGQDTEFFDKSLKLAEKKIYKAVNAFIWRYLHENWRII